MKRLEIVIKPEKLDNLKEVLEACGARGVMIANSRNRYYKAF